MSKDDDIFSDNFDKNQDNIEHSEFTEIPKMDEEPKKKNVAEEIKNKTPRRTLLIIGAVVIGLAVGGSAYGIQMGIISLNIQQFDPSACHYGVHSDFFSNRCITLEEYENSQKPVVEKEVPEPVSQPDEKKDPFKDVSSATDKVEIEKTKDIIGYYKITSKGDWYGDFVDIRKIPSKIENSGNKQINFRCYTDNFAKTSTYFGTFRNVIDDYMKVEVYISGKLVNSKETNTNKALILEGSCY